jgi:hypothetical protein
MLEQPGRPKMVERRKLPRIPVAIPVRYATEDGQVGIGGLIDVHEQGAGLLVPKVALEAMHLWLQFLWFDDRIGLQGRVTFARETPEGFHLGLQLHMLHPDSVKFLTDLLIPLSLQKYRQDKRRGAAFLDALLPGRHRSAQKRYLPVLVAQDRFSVWAITEDRHDEGTVLLLPQLPQGGGALTLTTLGGSPADAGRVVRSEALKLAPVDLFRIWVMYVPAPARQEMLPLQASQTR